MLDHPPTAQADVKSGAGDLGRMAPSGLVLPTGPEGAQREYSGGEGGI